MLNHTAIQGGRAGTEPCFSGGPFQPGEARVFRVVDKSNLDEDVDVDGALVSCRGASVR
jgi:hypothetical protein